MRSQSDGGKDGVLDRAATASSGPTLLTPYAGWRMPLQCSGCGDLVSEFAARCPACHHPVDDAVELPDPISEPDAAAEPEGAAVAGPAGASRRWTRRAVVMGAALVLAGLAATGLIITSLGGASSSPDLASVSGAVAAQSPVGTVTWVDPTDSKPLERPPLAGLSNLDPVAVSSDGATLLDASGTLVTIEGERVVARPTALGELLASVTSPASPSALADHNQAVLLRSSLETESGLASLFDLSDGHRVDLGAVDSAEADPQSLGAFVSVPAGSAPGRGASTAGQDTSVELRVAGAAPVVLATAGRLDREVGWSSGTAVRLEVYPNSTGDAVAVVLNPLSPQSGDVPMVILARDGTVLAALTDETGPSSGSQPLWSPGGHQIAYPTLTAHGPAMAISTETGAVETYPAPAATTFGTCVWSPASTDVLCQSRSAGRDRWLYATPTANHLISTPSFGDPLTWLAVVPVSHA